MALPPTAYAVVYRPQSDGTWRATFVDFPEIEISAKDIDSAKIRIAKAGRDFFAALEAAGTPIPETHGVVGYVRPGKVDSDEPTVDASANEAAQQQLV